QNRFREEKPAGSGQIFRAIGDSMCYNITLASLEKGIYGFDGQKNAHSASKPLTIQQVFSAGFSLPERFSAPAKLRAPDGNGFMSDFWFLRCRWA
ncbi:MAG: hypothetical protein SPI26_09140, partial [Oscillospiraceae bacterium]|nr:hypothetical protein [Oscillospiraceae bacterium]